MFFKNKNRLIRKSFFLSIAQVEKLENLKLETGASEAELIRRSLDEYLTKREEEKERV